MNWGALGSSTFSHETSRRAEVELWELWLARHGLVEMMGVALANLLDTLIKYKYIYTM